MTEPIYSNKLIKSDEYKLKHGELLGSLLYPMFYIYDNYTLLYMN